MKLIPVIKTLLPVRVKKKIAKELDDLFCLNFNGWGMKTIHELPWNGPGNEYFLKANSDVKKYFEFSGDDGVELSDIDSLMWRHWIVCYCIRHAVKFTDEISNLVECGVCNGLTAYFALSELQGSGSNVKMHLYDAWAPMREDLLLESEKKGAGHYSNISVERVKKNLSKFDNVVYHPGYIPESFHIEPPYPEKISYLHIDLNSAIPTVAALDQFFLRLAKGGIVLFDDYGWLGFRPTKEAVDKFFVDKPGILMPLPTGQAIYYR